MMTILRRKIHSRQLTSNGFTLVELIIVIILLAIVAGHTSSKYMGASSFSSVAAQEQVISLLRRMQIIVMQSNHPDNAEDCRSILLSPVQFSVEQACLQQGMADMFLSDYSQADNQQQLKSIILSYHFNSADGMVSVANLSFDLLGRPIMMTSAASTALCIDSDCKITITTASTNESRSVCINRQGFIYRALQDGNCVL